MAKATAKAKATFLIKSEPSVYSFDQLVQDGSTTWDGVRNYEARNNLRAMKKGDLLLYYHSNVGKEIVGIARVARAAYEDPKSAGTGEDWSAVDVEPVKKLKVPVTLAQAKAHPVLSKMGLVKKSRISVTQVTPEELAAVLALAKTKA
jgi:predicted RNA-binding protein with PUA-like domain